MFINNESNNKQHIETLKQAITSHQDFPKPGILFYNILPLFQQPSLHTLLIDQCIHRIQHCTKQITHICGIDARGFLLGTTIAYKLQIPFIPIRKANKLPPPVYTQSYALEYGVDTVEIEQQCNLNDSSNVCIVDDLLATAGTMCAAIALVQQTGAHVVQCLCVIELLFLNGRKNVADKHGSDIQINCLIQYEQ